ncbi:DivIVA domain-containing protein [Deinococcus cavernae]|uniref:DivIVA domain-containing protein n=1 Tax=Deinococcus cavernae TaxID=2320857 RepID=A0A418VBF7_9DEIO|nr:DivIVA domain-containing protein [Deinococcus cavernae]RJF73332.1 DivIVA domain-containing protein [Deinococcus cavernae]
MKYSPRDLTHQTFPTRLRGLDAAAVQNFLADVAQELEELLRCQSELEARVEQLGAELNEKKEQEEEIRRVFVAAERVSHDLKENAIRESELLVAQANTHAQDIQREQERRTAQLEATHQERMSALEIAYRTRHTDLERQQHELTLKREHEHAGRVAHLEKQFSDQYLELTGRLNAARHEYSQFLNGYRALVNSFAELSSKHLLPEPTRLPQQVPSPSTEPARAANVIDQNFQ